MFQKHNQPSLKAALVVILLVISIFSLGYYTEDKVTRIAVKEIGRMIVKVGKK